MKNRTIAIIIAVLLALVLLAVGAAAYLYLHFYRAPADDLFETASDIGERDVRKIPLAKDTINVLCCGVDESEELTDVIMVVRYDPKTGRAAVLSIPRDTFLGDEYPTGKINAVYRSTGDIRTLMQEVEERFLLPVDYYAIVTLDALVSFIDQLGGVEVTIPQDIYDQGVKLFDAGTQVLDGFNAMLYVRQRHAYVDADLGRINAQHDFLLAVMKKVQSLGKLDMLRLVMNNFGLLKTDIPLGKLMSIAVTAFSITEDDIEMFTAPGVGKFNYSYAVYEIDRQGLAELLNGHFLPDPVEADDLGFPAVTAPQPTPTPQEAPEEAPGETPAETPGAEDGGEETEPEPSRPSRRGEEEPARPGRGRADDDDEE